MCGDRVYVYYDADHNDLEVFSTLEDAKACVKKRWGHEPEWEEGPDGRYFNDVVSEYVTIYVRVILG